MCHRDLFEVTGDGAKDRRKVSEEEDYEEEAERRMEAADHEEGSGEWVYEVEEAVAEAVAEYDEVLAAYSEPIRISINFE